MKILYLNDVGINGGAEKILKITTSILKDFYEVEVIFGTSGEISRYIKNNDIKITILNSDFKSKIKLFKYFKMYFYLIKLLKNSDADVVVINSLFMQLFASPVVKFFNKTLIWHEHNIQPLGFRRKFIRLYANILPDKIIAVSNAVKDVYKDLKIYQNVKTIYNGIAPMKHLSLQEQKQMRKKLNIGEDKKVLISVSRLTEYKGIDILIKAFNKLQNNNIVLLIVGDAISNKDLKYKNYLYDLSKNNKNIKFLGWVDDVYKYINIANFFIAPAKKPDPFPTTILECMSIGTITLVSDIGGQPEAVNNEDLLFLPNDIENLISILNKFLYLDSQQLNYYSEYLFKRFYNNFTIGNYKQNILNFFKEVENEKYFINNK